MRKLPELDLIKESLQEALWDRFKYAFTYDKKTKCWIWTRQLNTKGYGLFSYGSKKYLAHRVSYLMFHGDIDDGMCICHTCDTPSCVNPKHLWQGTRAENNIDRNKKGREGDRSGERNGRSILTWDVVDAIREGYTDFEGSVRQYADQWNIPYGTMDGVLSGRRWKEETRRRRRRDVPAGSVESRTIDDGFGGYWAVECPMCGQATMTVVRPGKVQCTNCG